MANNPSGKSRGSRATPSAANRNQQARPGDATGAERDRLAAENAAAQREAAQHMSLISSPPVVEHSDTVVDYTGGGTPNPGQEAPTISLEEATADGQTVVSSYDLPESAIDIDALPDGTTDVLPQMVERSEEPQPAAGPRRDSRQPERGLRPQPNQQPVVERVAAPVVEHPHRVMRVNTDLEDITIGKDNLYTFRVGQPYKVTREVYDHLSEKGYVMA